MLPAGYVALICWLFCHVREMAIDKNSTRPEMWPTIKRSGTRVNVYNRTGMMMERLYLKYLWEINLFSLLIKFPPRKPSKTYKFNLYSAFQNTLRCLNQAVKGGITTAQAAIRVKSGVLDKEQRTLWITEHVVTLSQVRKLTCLIPLLGNATKSGSCNDKKWAKGSHRVKSICDPVAKWCQQRLSDYAAVTFTLDHVGWSVCWCHCRRLLSCVTARVILTALGH